MAKGKTSNPGIRFSVDDSKLQAMLSGLSDKAMESALKDVMKQASRLLVPMAKRSAEEAGFGRMGKTESESGWEYTRFGRIPRAIAGGKVYRYKGAIRTRLYIKQGKKHGFMFSAPHANPQIAGYKQFIPKKKGTVRRIADKLGFSFLGRFGGSSRSTGKVHAPRPIFGLVKTTAPSILDTAVLKVIDRIVARARRKHGG